MILARSSHRTAKFAAVLLLGALLAACSSSQPQSPPAPAQGGSPTAAPAGKQPDLNATLRLGFGADVVNIDPHNYRSSIDLMVDNLIYDTLIDADPVTGAAVPRLATSWEVTGPTTIRFKLRQGVKYHDGSPFNAQAAKVSFERLVKAYEGPTFFPHLKQVNVVDDSTIDMILDSPFAPQMGNLTMAVAGVMEPKAMQKYGPNPVTDIKDMLGTGPYKVVNWIPKQEIDLVRNDDYWGPKPQFAKIVIKPIPDDSARLLALRAGDIDAEVSPPAAEIAGLKKDPKFQVVTTPQNRMVWLGFNFNDPILGKNLKLRQAIAAAVDTKSIVDDALEGMVKRATDGPVPPGVIKTDPPLAFTYDQARAKQLLADAGYPNGLKLQLWTPNGRYFGDKTVAEVVQAQLAKIGIQTEIKTQEWGALQAAYGRHEQQLYIIGWGWSSHPDTGLRQTMYSKSALNWSALNDPKLDQAMDDAVKIFDPNQEKKAYHDISQMLMDEVFGVPVYYAVNVWATSSKVHDFFIHPQEKLDLTKTWIEK